MKNYDLSAIMKKAWTTYRKFQSFIPSLPFAECLRRAWAEAKNPRTDVTMCVIGKETFTVDVRTGIVTGKTYNSRKFLKDNFNAAWDGQHWTVDVEKYNSEMEKYPSYYKKYIVAEHSKADLTCKETLNLNDGFYVRNCYSDGSHRDVFIG